MSCSDKKEDIHINHPIIGLWDATEIKITTGEVVKQTRSIEFMESGRVSIITYPDATSHEFKIEGNTIDVFDLLWNASTKKYDEYFHEYTIEIKELSEDYLHIIFKDGGCGIICPIEEWKLKRNHPYEPNNND